jgi:microcystin-dependent protein
MSEPFLSEIKIVSFNFPPKGWALCNGQLLPINQNQALFSLLGTTYGGDGRVNFALPDLRGRLPIHFGNNHNLGEAAGEENHTLLITELAAHTHTFSASDADPNQGLPTGNIWASNSGAYSSGTPDSAMNPASISSVGGSQAHVNMQPYLVLNFVIALQGIFPSHN